MAKKQVKYEGNNYQESDFDPMDIYFNKYDRIAEETYDVSSKKNAEIKEHIHSEAKKIYKYYLKQGARYGVSAAAVVAGVVGLASGVLPVMVLGGALTAAGVGGVGVTRFGRAKRNELTYNRALDGKRLRYLWSEARRIRKIDRYIETLKDVRKNHPERVDKARSLEKRINRELHVYETKALAQYKKTQQDIKNLDRKFQKEPNAFARFGNWLGFHWYDDAREVKDRQLRAFRDDFVYGQLLFSRKLREEAGLERNKSVDNFLIDRAKDNAKKAKASLERLEKNNAKRKENIETIDDQLARIENKSYSPVIIERLKEKIKAEKLEGPKFAHEIGLFAQQNGLTKEELFTICESVKFGKQSKLTVLNYTVEDIRNFSDEARQAMLDQVMTLKDKPFATFEKQINTYIENKERRGDKKSVKAYKSFMDDVVATREAEAQM